MNCQSKFKHKQEFRCRKAILRLNFEDPIGKVIEVELDCITPLTCYKRLYQRQLKKELYGKMLKFYFKGKRIRYVVEAQKGNGGTNQDLEIQVSYDDFPVC